MKNENRVYTVDIDVDYFNEIVEASGLSCVQFAASVGKTNSFVHNTRARGRMVKQLAALVCKLYDADIDKLIIKPEEPQPEAEPEQPRVLMSDDSTLTALVGTLNRLEKKIDKLMLSGWNNGELVRNR